MSKVLIPALDGTNPLGFLAALGLLSVMERADGVAEPRLYWVSEQGWRPVVCGAESVEAIIELVVGDLERWRGASVLALSYEKTTKKGTSTIQDLKAPPERFRSYLSDLLTSASPTERTDIDLATAFAAEMGLDNNGQTKPTALHFMAGQQQFLKAVLQLHSGLAAAMITEALVGPWSYESQLPVLGWDVANDRNFALRAHDPSKDKKTGIPGADWLGLIGLEYLPVWARRGKAVTTGFSGGWKRGQFHWPLWTEPLSASVVRSLLGLDFVKMNASERGLCGVTSVLQSSVHRSDQGGYGQFAPAEYLP